MEPAKIVTLLEGTINPTLRKDAEEQLESMRKISGFTPLIMQIVMSEEIQMAIRQAGAIYMKNTCIKWWQEKDPQIFHIHEDDKQAIRNNIVEAITIAPDIIRSQLTVILSEIIKNDYPGKWPAIVDKISNLLQADDAKSWMGGLLTMYQLVKSYEYKTLEKKEPLIAAMKLFIQPLLILFKRFMPDNSSASVLMQKQILKIIYALIQYSLPLELFGKEVLDEWMMMIKSVIERGFPPEVDQVDPLERPDLPWWKCKKWALHILARVFERYGSPGSVSKEYNQFAEFFLKRYAVSVTQVLLKLLDNHRNGAYITPRVLQQTLHFISQGVSHAHTWKVTKTVFEPVLKEIVFPLMCFTDEDQEIWEDDPHEYLRKKFDVFEDFLSPESAAQCLLVAACKRKQMLQKTMGFCYSVLTSNDIAQNPRQKDGAMHIIGTLAETLTKRKIYKGQMEMMLTSYVVSEYKSQHAFLRARACWVTQLFSEVKFKKDSNLLNMTEGLKLLLINDKELPVKVEAAIALQTVLCDQPKAEKYCQPHVRDIVMTLLQLVHETANDDLNCVVQKMICLYSEQIIPLAIEITQSLASTFMKMLTECETADEEAEDDKSVAALGVLTTIETVLDMMEDERSITVQLEGIVTPVVAHVLKNRNIDFYEDTFSLFYSITCQAISPPMWEGLLLIYEVFQDDGFDYFTDMMPCLHNFVTIDTETFLSNPKYLEILYNMCKKVLNNEAGEDPESHAAKLIEVIILQCKGRIDQCIPLFVELALTRLTKEVKMKELRTMCLQVVVAALYYNPTLLLATLEQMRFPNSTESISNQFFGQWLNDAQNFQGIHDRRVCALGLCTLLNLQNRSPFIDNLSAQIIPSLINLYQGLVKAYKTRGDGEVSDSDEEDEEDENGNHDYEEEQELDSSEDEIDEESAEYLEMLEKKAEDFIVAEYNDDEDDFGETTLEPYTTTLEGDNADDEFIAFKNVLCSLETRDPNFYQRLVTPLNNEQRKSLQEIYNLADQRQAAAESKKIEKTGGYQFNLTNIPTTFQFGNGAPASLSP